MLHSFILTSTKKKEVKNPKKKLKAVRIPAASDFVLEGNISPITAQGSVPIPVNIGRNDVKRNLRITRLLNVPTLNSNKIVYYFVYFKYKVVKKTDTF